MTAAAIVIHSAGDLRVEAAPVQEPGPGQVAIDVAFGGICGSDLHYYHNGGFGDVRVKEPMVLGHEVSGTIAATGDGVSRELEGQAVAINPSRPCWQCQYCHSGMPNHCMDMRFYGSAMRTPHIQGAFQQALVADATQCVSVDSSTSLAVAAFAEPFSVALHAIQRAGTLSGKRVLVTGCGPIGAAVVAAVAWHGALEVVATDVVDFPLQCATAVGADRTVNVATSADSLDVGADSKGYFDVMIEASGNELAVRSGLDWLKPRGVLVQLGLGSEVTLPQNKIVSKEIEVRGSFRFHHEFEWAVELLTSGKVDVSPIITDTFYVQDAVAAFDAASDRNKAMKVQIDFASPSGA